MVSYLVEPATYADRRAMSVTELQTGQHPKMPPAVPWRPVTMKDGVKQQALMRKMHMRKARALSGKAMAQLALGRPPQAYLKGTIMPLVQEAMESEYHTLRFIARS